MFRKKVVNRACHRLKIFRTGEHWNASMLAWIKKCNKDTGSTMFEGCSSPYMAWNASCNLLFLEVEWTNPKCHLFVLFVTEAYLPGHSREKIVNQKILYYCVFFTLDIIIQNIPTELSYSC